MSFYYKLMIGVMYADPNSVEHYYVLSNQVYPNTLCVQVILDIPDYFYKGFRYV